MSILDLVSVLVDTFKYIKGFVDGYKKVLLDFIIFLVTFESVLSLILLSSFFVTFSKKGSILFRILVLFFFTIFFFGRSAVLAIVIFMFFFFN